MAFNSVIFAPDPTPMENTVTPIALSLAASDAVADILLD